ncbi:MAG: SAM-dependent methyltransferase [Paraglaciecola sp.]|jgi:SAM-dependent methyltransferase
MGISNGLSQLLVRTAAIDVCNKKHGQCRVLTLGRLTMSIKTEQQKEDLIHLNSNIRHSSLKLNSYCENFLKDIGATSVESLDFSDFEGASHIYNLNDSFANDNNTKHLKEAFDLVLDFGTSEHVFQPGLSIANSLFMLKPGGRLILNLPITGFLEHGFYQFCPNIFHQIKSENLTLERLYILEPYKTPLQIWDGLKVVNNPLYESLNGKFSSFAMYQKKSEIVEKIFLATTQQAVYASSWESHSDGEKKVKTDNNENNILRKCKVFIYRLLMNYRFYKIHTMLKQRISIDEIKKIN